MLSAQSVMSNKMKIKKDHKHGPAMPCRIAASRECERWPRWMRKGSQIGRAIPLRAFVAAVKHGVESPVRFESLYASTLATFRIRESLQCGRALPVHVCGPF